MTKNDLVSKDTALKMAIEALEDYPYEHRTAKMDDALQACKEALALSEKQHTFPDKKQPAQSEYMVNEGGTGTVLRKPAQEPVAWRSEGGVLTEAKLQAQSWVSHGGKAIPLYTHPAPSWQGNKEFVGLSDDEIDALNGSPMALEHSSLYKFARAIEQELKTKNGFSGLKEKNT